MKVVFLTLSRISHIEDRGIYSDLMRKFRNEGHEVYIVSPCERRLGLNTSMTEDQGVRILNVKTFNVQKTNIIEKGLGTLLIERQFLLAIKKYLEPNILTMLLIYITYLHIIQITGTILKL